MRALVLLIALVTLVGCTHPPEPTPHDASMAWSPSTRTLPRDPFRETGYPNAPPVLTRRSRDTTGPSLADHYPLPDRWKRVRPGELELYVLGVRDSTRVQLFMDNGKMDEDALDSLKLAFGDLKKKRTRHVNGRLLTILYLVGQAYERPVILVSGFRAPGGKTKSTSRHATAQAADIRLPGVPPEHLAELLRANFENVGVGHYPTSKFVHIDVRDKSYYWVDHSGPGQKQRERAVELKPTPEPGTDWTLHSTTLPEYMRPVMDGARTMRN